jgi:CIC family chloride channel protein
MRTLIKRLFTNTVFILAITSIIVGFFAAVLALALKHLTESFEERLFHKAYSEQFLLFILPAFALSMIWVLRKFLFHNKENKGISEVFNSMRHQGKKLPAYKIPSHFVNGFLTVAFGGSTGIEISTVVSSGTVGSLASRKLPLLRQYKNELICGGVAAGVAALFASPLAGILFAYEVIARRRDKLFLIAVVSAVLSASLLAYVLKEPPMFHIATDIWHLHATPWMAALGVLAGLFAIYLTRVVILLKRLIGNISRHYVKVFVGALAISIAIYIFPELYGDGYHVVNEMFVTANSTSISGTMLFTIIAILLIKPALVAITLAAGGDGGIFGPSLFIGAFLGLLTAVLANTFFNADVLPVNFMVIGMAAMLSASIHAPLTAIFLVCAITGNYNLFLPLAGTAFLSQFVARAILPYNLYTHKPLAIAVK